MHKYSIYAENMCINCKIYKKMSRLFLLTREKKGYMMKKIQAMMETVGVFQIFQRAGDGASPAKSRKRGKSLRSRRLKVALAPSRSDRCFTVIRSAYDGML